MSLREIAEIANQRRDRGTLDLGQVGVPRVEDHDDARFLAAIPGTVLVRVVEYDDTARLPVMQLAADIQRAVVGNRCSGRCPTSRVFVTPR